jgi:SAM-dependent methyltransferase
MGLGPAARELYKLLDLKPPLTICDLGSQEMSYVDDDGNATHRESAREWCEKQGFVYQSIDIDGKRGAVVLDLNVCTVFDIPFLEPHRFDVVANHGTSEHVFNQANVFRLMHDMTRVGGLMIHAVPTLNFGAGHGFYFYDETIFSDLAYANKYEIVAMHRRSEPREIILVAMRKVYDFGFEVPIQGMYR